MKKKEYTSSGWLPGDKAKLNFHAKRLGIKQCELLRILVTECAPDISIDKTTTIKGKK